MHGSSGVGHLVDRHPSVTPGAADRPAHPAADVRRRQLRHLQAGSGRAVAGRGRAVLPAVLRRRRSRGGRARRSCSASARRCRVWALSRRRVRRRQDAPAGVVVLPIRSPAPKAFATFGELTQLAGVFGFVECIDLLADYVVVCIDEFELDDPGNTTLISRLLSQLVERGVSVAATSNTLPEQLGEGRFAAQDFLREINTLASIFTTVRIEGPDYRHRDLPPAPEPLSDEEVATRAAAGSRRDAGRLRRAVRAPGDHASVALSDADRGCHRRCSSPACIRSTTRMSRYGWCR